MWRIRSVTIAVGIIAGGLSVPAAYAAQDAVQARVLSVHDSSKLHLIKSVGNVLTEEGKVTGTLPGTARVTIDLHESGGTASARLILHCASGSITSQASGRGHEGQGGWESFSGNMSLRGGSGRYAHASGSGHMYGALNRRNDELVVQTSVLMHY